MTENKKGLRMAAGIIMLVMTLFGIAIQVASYFASHNNRYFGFFEVFWMAIIGWIISIAIAVFVLCRLFKGAAITECVAALYAVFGIVGNVTTLITAKYTNTPVAYSVILMFGNLCSVAGTVMLIIGYFKHNAGSKKLFLIAAIISIVNNVIITPTASTVLQASFAYSSSSAAIMALTTNYGSGILSAAAGSLPLFLLAAYFGAQGDKAPAAPAYSAPQYMPPQGYVPQQGAPQQSVNYPQQGANYPQQGANYPQQ